MALRFFIDDSGKNDPPVFVLGGVGIEEDRVEAFETAWNAVLAAVPAIPFLKTKDANRKAGAFKGMTHAQRDEKMAALGEVLRDHVTATVAVLVRHDDYQRIFAGKMMHWMDRPYQMMFHLTIATVYKLCKEQGFGETASFVFDRQLDHEAALRESFPAMIRGAEPALKTFLTSEPRHADDKEEVALQAADLVAWHVRRSWKDGSAALAAASTAGPAIVALPGKHDLFTEAALQFLANIAAGTVRRLKTVFPYEADEIASQFDRMATYANLHLIADALPFDPVELISFPAIGTGKYRLVHRCAELDRPHLHRQSGMRCLGEATTA